VQRGGLKELSAEQRREVAAWLKENSPSFPEPVRVFLALHHRYLSADGDLRKPFNSVVQELRRALGITPSSEKRPSGSPRAGVPRAGDLPPMTERERLAEQLDRSERLGDWHKKLNDRHENKVKRIKEKLADMQPDNEDPITEDTPLEDIELTEKQIAEAKAAGVRFGQHLQTGNGTDPALKSVNETLMPGGTVLAYEDYVSLPATLPAELSDAEVVKTLCEPRVRYDFSVTVTRLELDVEKKVVVDEGGERHVITASTSDFGPPRFSVTWSALATLAIMVCQFALPMHRLGIMLSTAGKRFTSGSLSRMLHYVAERLLPIYLQLAKELANSEVLGGDDTSCRVLEVSAHLAKAPSEKDRPPWAEYRTPKAADERFRQCEAMKKERMRRRADGDRDAKRTPEETPSLGVLIGRSLPFESLRRNRDGAKEAMHTTVVSGRAVADDPASLIVFYRSHLGSHGNLLEALLQNRSLDAKKLTIQGDLSTTNLVASPELRARFEIRTSGCAAHARRPFANYEHEDPVNCSYMLHLFTGLAIHEDRLDVHGRNRQNVLAVRQHESRELWELILAQAKEMAEKWSPATKLGAGARYIINHFDELTAYLDDPRLEPTNNLRERMLRTEKLIEGSSMFRRSLEGRFVLDVIRTVLQTAVAADVQVFEYLISVLRANPADVAEHPERFTPRAWVAAAKLVARAVESVS
jgi:hypothetical protein